MSAIAALNPGGVPSRLLVVDDDDVDRERISRLLVKTRPHSQIVHAASKAEAKSELRNNTFDCVFLDNQLGDGLGIEIIREIPEFCAEPPPVVLVTGGGDERLAVNALQGGAYDYIPKERLDAQLVGDVLDGCVRRAVSEKERRQQYQRLERLSLYDTLTEVPNRTLFFERLEQQLRLAHRAGTPFAIAILDLDLFKAVNDRYGHDAGDEVLQVVARRIGAALRHVDTVARLGGDEFGLILDGTDCIRSAETIAGKISAIIREPIALGECTVKIGVSIGVALSTDHSLNAKNLMKIADRAMYYAKTNGVGYHVSEGSVPETASVTVAPSMLFHALQNHEMFVEYQPIIQITNRRVIGVEALVRWRCPTLGVLRPDQFVPIAERSQLIRPMTLSVLNMALDRAQIWRTAGFSIPVSVNLSARLIEDRTLPPQILAALKARDLPPSILTLEITETALSENIVQSCRVLGALSSAGIRISIDDFGAGFTSFKYLREMNVSEIKIDQLYTSDIAGVSRDRSIVHAIATLAHGFGIPSIAEGIEDISLLETFRSLGCENGQGFGIGRPMSSRGLLKWLATWNGGRKDGF